MPELRAPKGATHKKRIVGRGIGSTRGGTSGKGHKGQNARSGGGVRPGFEGGQMPLYRRIARRGFSNYRSKKHFQIVNVGELSKRFDAGAVIDEKTLVEKRLIKGNGLPAKILGTGEVDKKLEVNIDKMSKSARQKIEAAGGKVQSADAEKPTPAEKKPAATKAVKDSEPEAGAEEGNAASDSSNSTEE